MKTQITLLIIITIIVMQCKKQNTVNSDRKKPTAVLVSTTARLLDTAAFAPKRYMHFLITFNIITGDSDIYFSQLQMNYQRCIKFLGPDTVYNHTPYRPMILTTLPEVIPEGDVYKINAHDTVQVSYFGMIVAHGAWIQFYMQAYEFPYSLGINDGVYESGIIFDNSFVTTNPH
jgi:hypothetical protein